MNQRLYDGMAAGLAILLLATLAVGTFYLAQTADRGDAGAADRGLSHDPDYFAENFAITKLNREGAAVFRMAARRMEHYPDDDSTSFVLPTLVSLDPAKPLVTLRADRGTSTSEGIETRLYDNVVLTRAAFEGNPPLKVESEYMLVLSEEDIARSDRLVTIHSGASVLTGVGMEFNNETRQLRVDSQVRGTWIGPPPERKGSTGPSKSAG